MMLVYSFLIAILCFMSLFFDARGDVNTVRNKTIDHNSQALSIMSLMSMFFVVVLKSHHHSSADFGVIYAVFVCFGYLFMRMGVFNDLYNTFDNTPNRIGTTDKIYDSFLLKLPAWIVSLIYIFSTILSVFFIFGDRVIERLFL